MTPSTPPSSPSPRAPEARLARSFGAVAEEYERGRPSYPAEALAWVVRDARQQVLDAGAGTGKLTRDLVAAGHRVLAADPSPEMLAHLREHAPRAWAVRARAEALPAVSRSVDVVVAAQAFHWFDAPVFLRECTRVLRVGGTLGLMWNGADLRTPWVRRLAELTEDPVLEREPTGDEDHPAVRAIDNTGLFETVEHRRFRNWQVLRKPALRDLVASRSDVAVRGPAAVEELLAQVDELFDQTASSHELQLPYVTHVMRTVVLPWAYVAPSTHRVPPAAQRAATEPPPGDPVA